MNTHEENVAINSKGIWQRGLYMLLFAFLISIARFVAFAVIILQFLFVLFSGATNTRLLSFGKSLSTYTYQVMLFLTFNSEQHPYPMSEWPGNEDTAIPHRETD